MVKLGLYIKADLEGVTGLVPVDTDADPFFYTFRVLCSSCHELHDTWITIQRNVRSCQQLISPSAGEGQYQWQSRRREFCLEM
jgi:CXXC motif containing zinc binding protein, eukaryotic